MSRFFGTSLYVVAGLLALAGVGAFFLMVFGIREDALAAAPAFLVAQPWASIFPLASEGAPSDLYTNIAALGAMLAINPILLFGLGRWLRKRENG